MTLLKQSADHNVTLDGKPVKSYVIASEELSMVVVQDFPSNWLPGDPLPVEIERKGRVKICEKIQPALDF